MSNGTYITAEQAIASAGQYPDIRLMVVGNKHDCVEPIVDWSDNSSEKLFSVAQPWARANASSVGSGVDVMGGAREGLGMSATCWYSPPVFRTHVPLVCFGRLLPAKAVCARAL